MGGRLDSITPLATLPLARLTGRLASITPLATLPLAQLTGQLGSITVLLTALPLRSYLRTVLTATPRTSCATVSRAASGFPNTTEHPATWAHARRIMATLPLAQLTGRLDSITPLATLPLAQLTGQLGSITVLLTALPLRSCLRTVLTATLRTSCATVSRAASGFPNTTEHPATWAHARRIMATLPLARLTGRLASIT